jgi:toxin ParE1/3/4
MLNNIKHSFPSLQFTTFAQTDIGDTWQYLGEFGEDIAEKLITEIIEKCLILSRNTKIGRERNDLIVNLRQFAFKNYNIFYFPTENGVETHRVLHSSRDNIQVFDTEIDRLN